MKRRVFLKSAMATGAGLLIFPNGLRGQTAPGNKLNIALIGTWGRGLAHFEHQPFPLDPGFGEISADLRSTILRSGRSEDGGAVFAQFKRDGLADPARSPCNKGDLSVQHMDYPRIGSVASIAAASASAIPVTPSALRLTSPARTLPGPHSATSVMPMAAIFWIVSTQRTGE